VTIGALPIGWVQTSLESVADWASGGTPSRSNDAYFTGDIPWVKTGELGPMFIRDTQEKLTPEAISSSSAKVFPKGSVGIAMYGATIGRLSIWAIDASTNQACAVAQPIPGVLFNEFLYYFLLSQKRKFIEAGKGGAQPNISQGLLRQWPICLPPLREQHRIVARIEELFSELDKGIENLKLAQSQLAVYRQALLKHAFEGKLTANWRAANADQLESGEKLLQRVLIYRRSQWEEAQLRRFEKVGKAVLANWKSKYREPSPQDSAKLPPLPKEWIWSTVEQLARVSSGQTPSGMPTGSEANGSVSWFRVGDMNARGNKKWMTEGGVALSEQTTKRLGLKLLPAGSIIFPKRGGAIATNKKRRLKYDACCDLNLMAVSPVPFIADYLWWFFQGIDLARLSDGSNVPQINNPDIVPLPVPLPPIAEQAVIVDAFEHQISIIDRLESEIEINLTTSEALRRSILKKAFAGELVPQDPNDESAAALLDRIRADRASERIASKSKIKKPRAAKA
jgi:type I restriction enzyme S subunit